MKFESCILSNKGKVRPENEDSFAVSEKDGVWIICDGMGGSVAGKFASSVTTKIILDHILEAQKQQQVPLRDFYEKNLPFQSVCLAESIQLANRMLFTLAMKYPSLQGMGTTVCSLMIHDGIAYISHVGDSRLYLFKNTKLHQITRDHSFVMELLEDKEISKKEAIKFKQKNVITRALGVNKHCDLDLYVQPVTPHTKFFLICTDGLWNVVSESEIESEIMNPNNSTETICRNLIDKANSKGGPDNITVAAVKIIEHDKPKVNLAGLYEKVITISNRNKTFLKAQDRLLPGMIKDVKGMLPPKVKKEHSREIIMNVLLYVAVSILLIGILYLINMRIQLMQATQ
ncbi:MAG: Stp1/IreP family PP2C-type Ser/Thr phosphatase [Elusimicrobiota bacterium]